MKSYPQSISWGLMLFLLILTSPVHGQTPKEQPSGVSLDVTEAYLEDVLKLISKQSGLNFVTSEEAREKKVTMYLERVPVFAALNTLLEANGLVMQRVDGAPNLHLITQSGANRVITVTKVFRLKYARVLPSAGEITPTFGLSGSLITQTIQGTGSSGGGGGGGGRLGGQGGSGGGGGGENTTGLLNIIRSILTKNGSVVSDPRTNSLIVTDIPECLQVVEETISKLDIKPTQIYIEAEVLEVTLDTLRRLGLEFGSSTGTIGSYTGPVRSSFFPFAENLLKGASRTNTLGILSFTQANILFKLLATESDVKFLARPRLLTLSNEVAEIRIVAEAVTGVTSTSQATTGTVTETVERNTVGTILRVTPLVNEDRYVTMVIEPEISRAIQSSSFSNFLNPNRRLARTTVMVPDNHTVLIAGLISSENTEASRRVPGIGDIPLVGLPFKRTETERKNTEIILFITPHIVREEAAAFTALDEREQSPISIQEQHLLETHRQRLLKERAFQETIENILR